MPGQFEGKVALVTGASSGIGRATALAFASAGANVVVADRAVAGGEETASMIQDAGGDAIFVRTNITQAAEVQGLIAQVVETYGRLDCAHNNAGVAGARANTADYPEDMWQRVLNVNLTGVWLCMKYEIPHMLRQGGGAIVNTASVAGLVGIAGNAAYNASKHGVVGLTKTAALEYALSGIRINAVCPGVIGTEFIQQAMRQSPELEQQYLAVEPIGRLGKPEEIAETVLWLCSDAASFVTGHALAVDGGWVAQ